MFHLYSTVLISASPNASFDCQTHTRLPAYLRLVLGNLAAFTHGSCIVYPSQTFDPAEIVDALLEEKYAGVLRVPSTNVILPFTD